MPNIGQSPGHFEVVRCAIVTQSAKRTSKSVPFDLERTATLPRGWRERLIKINNANTFGITGLCLEVHDLAISKYVAGRDKDREFTSQLVKHRMVRRDTLMARERDTALSPEIRKLVRAWIARDFKATQDS